MLNENSIRVHLVELIKRLKAGDLDQAEATIDALEFNRLLQPTLDPSKGARIKSRDPAKESGIGTERAHEIGTHLLRLVSFLHGRNTDGALREAEAALAGWDAGR
jgi:hypothetical protein